MVKITPIKKENKLIYHLKDRDIEVQLTTHVAQSIINKTGVIEKNLNHIINIVPELEDVLFKILTFEVFEALEVSKLVLDIAEKYVDSLDVDYQQFCQVEKKTKTSIFFEPEEVKNIFKLITAVKILTPVLHSDSYERKAISRQLMRYFRSELVKIFKMIYHRLTFTIDNLAFLKYAMDPDYIVHYNFEFVVLTALPFYDFEQLTNPISFMISVAADNSNFMVLTYSGQNIYHPEEYLQPSKIKNLLIQLSDELLIHKIYEYVKQQKITINESLVPSPVYKHIVVPLVNKITGISRRLLLSDHIKKLHVQYMLYKIVIDTPSIRRLFRDSVVYLLYAFEKEYTSSRQNISPAIIKLLQFQVTPETIPALIKIVDDFSLLQYKPLTHIFLPKQYTDNVHFIDQLVSFIVKDVPDEVIQECRQTFKKLVRPEEIVESDTRHIQSLLSSI